MFFALRCRDAALLRSRRLVVLAVACSDAMFFALLCCVAELSVSVSQRAVFDVVAVRFTAAALTLLLGAYAAVLCSTSFQC